VRERPDGKPLVIRIIYATQGAPVKIHELMRAWEAVHRTYQGEAHVRSILFREETRWPGYYFRADKPSMDNEHWLAFCNCKFDRASNTWEMIKRPMKYITEESPTLVAAN